MPFLITARLHALPARLMICNKHRSKGPRLGFIIRDRSADSSFVRAGDTVGGPEGTKELS